MNGETNDKAIKQFESCKYPVLCAAHIGYWRSIEDCATLYEDSPSHGQGEK